MDENKESTIIWIDGWNDESLTAYEFHGCVFHGCPKCFNNTSFNALKNEPMNQTYLKYMKFKK